MTIPTDRSYAEQLDARDPLRRFREQFVVAEPDLIYLDGNSLGRLPNAARERALDLIDRQWGERLIRSWNEGWIDLPERVGAKIAQLIGAQPGEIIVADSTSINLFKLVVAALRQQNGRTRIITDDLNFPSDIYVLEGAIDLLGDRHRLEIVRSPDDIHGPVEAIEAALDEDVALLTLSHTVFKSGFVYDMRAVTEAAHRVGALVLWDLSHSVGSVEVPLNEAQADLAIGCSYKYVNGGPGAPAFLYVRDDLQDVLRNPISGWMGQRNAFDFGLHYQPAHGLRQFLTGTPPVAALALIEPGVDLLLEAGIANLREKSMQQSEYLIALWEQLLKPLGYALNSPRDVQQRGSHVSLGHDEGLRIDRALIEVLKMIPDFRAPNNIRLGIAPLYTTFAEIHAGVERMQQAVVERIYERFAADAPVVT